MQRTICGSYHAPQNRTEESLTLLQTHNVHNVTAAGTVPQQLHWKRKLLNKPGLNKRRQNPARQAAVRSFKKYHFTNQDFLLRKYLRSVKKEMKPKQCDVPEPVTGMAMVSGSSNISRALVSNSNCVRHRNDIKHKSYANSINSNNNNNSNCCINSTFPIVSTAVPSSTISSKGKSQQNQDCVEVMSNKYNPVNVNEEIKSCHRKNWPTYGVDRPTLESVQQESLSLVVCDDDLKEVLKESSVFVKKYCESIKQLTEIVDCSDYKHVDKSLKKSCNINEHYYYTKNNHTVNNSVVGDTYINSNTNNGRGENNIYVESDEENLCRNNRYEYDDEVEDYDLEDNDEGDDYEEDDEDDDDDDDDDDEENDDDDEDNDEDDNDNGNSSDDCKYRVQKNKSNVQRGSAGSKMKKFASKCSSLNNFVKNDKENNIGNSDKQNLVVSIDTSDSSSVSSSQDNSSVSTETCCSDIQTITLNDADDNNNDVSEDCLRNRPKQKTNSNVGQHQQQFIKIRNREYPVSIFDNNPSLIEYLKSVAPETVANIRAENISLPNSVTKQCDVRDLMCNETEDRNEGYIKINNLKQSRFVNESKNRHLKYRIEDGDTRSHEKSVRSDVKHNVKDSRRRNMLKKANLKYEPLFSSVCSVEDGLAILDNQSQQPPVHHFRPASSQHNETITLYNNLTSCTLPFPGSTSNEISSANSTNSLDPNNDYLVLPNSVASQTVPLSPVRNSQSSPYTVLQTDQSQCGRCKMADYSLKESLQDSIMHLNDIVMSTVILNSFLTGECHFDIAEPMTKINND